MPWKTLLVILALAGCGTLVGASQGDDADDTDLDEAPADELDDTGSPWDTAVEDGGGGSGSGKGGSSGSGKGGSSGSGSSGSSTGSSSGSSPFDTGFGGIPGDTSFGVPGDTGFGTPGDTSLVGTDTF